MKIFFSFLWSMFLALIIIGVGEVKVYAQQKKIDSLERAVLVNPYNNDQKAKDLFFLSISFISSNPKKSLVYIDQVLSDRKSVV